MMSQTGRMVIESSVLSDHHIRESGSVSCDIRALYAAEGLLVVVGLGEYSFWVTTLL